MQLLAENYLEPGETYHIARFSLPATRPAETHCHDFFEVFLVEDGQIHHEINGEVMRLEAGDLVFIRPHDDHALWSVRGHSAQLVNLMFRNDRAALLCRRYPAELSDRFFWTLSQHPDQVRLDPAQHLALSDDLTRLVSAPRSQLVLDGFLTQLLSEQTQPGAAMPNVPHWLSEGLRRADGPMFLRQGARGLSEACGRSPAHVARVVRQRLNRSASEIMNAKRIAYAARLLLSTDQTVETIGHACGFENQSYFFRLFKARHGVTPRQFRQARFRNPVAPM